MINEYPYTDFNEYNMDWIIKTVKDLTVEWADMKTDWIDLESDFNDLKNYVNNYFANLNLQDEVNHKIDQMILDGTMNILIAPYFANVQQTVTDWIDDNLMQEVGYVIDKSLTVADAAADAEIAGSLITDNSLALARAVDSLSYLDNNAWIDGAFFLSDGTLYAATGFKYQYVRLPEPGNYVTFRQSTFGTNRYKLPLFNANLDFIKTLNAPQISGDSNASHVTFTLDAQDFREGARYVGVSVSGNLIFPLYKGTTWTMSTDDAGASPEWFIDRALKADEVTGPMYKKSLVSTGDSIANGGFDLPDSLHGWYDRLVTEHLMSGYQSADNGGVIRYGMVYNDNSPRFCICDAIATLYAQIPDADYVIMEGGTNDADLTGSIIGGTTPPKFGTWDVADFSGTYDKTTFCGAMDYMCYKAVTLFPDAKIAYIIPMQMGTTNTNSIKNRRAYFDTAKEICTKWHIPVLDLWNESHLDARLTEYYDPDLTGAQNVSAGKAYYDGQHPTSHGYDMMMGRIDSFMQSL